MKKNNNKSKSITYKESGVDIDKFEIILNDLKKEILSTFSDAVIDNFGSFSSVLDIKKLENLLSKLLELRKVSSKL